MTSNLFFLFRGDTMKREQLHARDDADAYLFLGILKECGDGRPSFENFKNGVCIKEKSTTHPAWPFAWQPGHRRR